MSRNSIKDFESYVGRDIKPALSELEKVAEASRIHLQKLVYTNLVDRFDALLDNLLLDCCTDEELMAEAGKILDKPPTQIEVYRLFLSPKKEEIVAERIQNALRNTILRERHSKKLAKVFSVVGKDKRCWNEPRVNVSTGKIYHKIKPQIKTIPYSICGYADWVYSRRNAVVHGAGGSAFLENDIEQLTKMFNCTPAKSVKLQLSAVKTTAAFYSDVIAIIK